MDADSLLWSIIFGSIGQATSCMAKARGRSMLLIFGALLCLLPYLTSMLVIGGALTLAPFFFKSNWPALTPYGL